MSRIHEALKKAEQERGGAAPVETSAPLPVRPQTNVLPPSDVNGGNGKSTMQMGVLTATTTMPSLQRSLQAPAQPSLQREGVFQWNDIAEGCSHPGWNLDPERSVFLDPTLTTDGAEQFRTLRSRLYQMRNDQPLHTLLITSALPGEGKTFVTSNLGQAIVRQNERRALIIDGDLRRSNLHTGLQAPSSPGLSDYLRGDSALLSVMQQGLGGNLCFIPGGSAVANPSELLANGRLKTLLESVGGVFDWILIDAPPYLPVADASILAELVDGVLLVVRARSTPSEVVAKASKELRGRKLLGVVMNGVDKSAGGYRSHYGSSYYGRDPQSSSE